MKDKETLEDFHKEFSKMSLEGFKKRMFGVVLKSFGFGVLIGAVLAVVIIQLV